MLKLDELICTYYRELASGCLSVVLGRLGVSWVRLGLCLAVLGRLQAIVGRLEVGGVLGSSQAVLASPWVALGCLGSVFGGLG